MQCALSELFTRALAKGSWESASQESSCGDAPWSVLLSLIPHCPLHKPSVAEGLAFGDKLSSLCICSAAAVPAEAGRAGGVQALTLRYSRHVPKKGRGFGPGMPNFLNKPNGQVPYLWGRKDSSVISVWHWGCELS